MPTQWSIRFWLSLILVAGLGCLPMEEAVASMPMRAVILFDTSGSMRTHDPQRLSVAAARLFLSLARPEDEVSVVAFSDRGESLAPLTGLTSPGSIAHLQALLMSLKFTGQTTDFAAALQAGLDSFPPTPPPGASRDVVILLTDGKLDLGGKRRADEPAILAHMREALLPQYRRRGIRIYTLAFTEAADQALLQEMAEHTEGAYAVIPGPERLHAVFSQLFLQARQAESVPVTDQTVLLDESIQEATLIFSKRQAQEPITLVTPQRERLHASSTRPDMTWTSTPAYDMVQMTNPEAGRWQIERSDGDTESLAVVGRSSVELQITLEPAFREAGTPMTLVAFLTENDQRVQTPERVQQLTMQAAIITPQGETRTLSLARHQDGTFVTTLKDIHDPGTYHAQVTASSAQLQRQRGLAFTVYRPCFGPQVEAGPPAMMRVTLAASCPTLHDLELQAGYRLAEMPTVSIPLMPLQPGLYTALLAPHASKQAAEVTLRIHGRIDTEGPFTLLKGPWTLPAVSPTPEVALLGDIALQMVSKLLLLNGVLVIVGGGGFGMYKVLRQQRKRVHD